MHLGTCMVTINYRDNKKKCEFFVVARNGQVLLGMPDTAAFKIIKVNIDYAGSGHTGWGVQHKHR